MWLRRIMGLLMAAVLVVTASATALAKERKAHEEFEDLGGSEWALSAVVEMQAKGIMKGTGDGKFEPNGSLTRAQAITVAIRLMGLESEALAVTAFTDAMLPFADSGEIPDWAKPNVAEAVLKNILPVAEDGMLRPAEKASRLWVSVLLVRALGFDAEAQAKMTATLPFQDAARIPPTLVGYVAASVDHGLIKGYPDETFRPNQPLTRAQAATLLTRTDSQLADLGKLRPGEMQGELLAVASSTLTLRTRTGDVQVGVAANAAIFVSEKVATLDQLTVGVKVAVVIGTDGNAVLVSARSPETNGELNREVHGKITAILLPSGEATDTGLISLSSEKGEKTWPLGQSVEFKSEVRGLTLADLKPGDKVELKLTAGVVVRIKLEKRSETSEERRDELKGTVVSVTAATASDLGTLTLAVASDTKTLKLAPGARVQVGERTMAVADLKPGDLVQVRIMGDVVVRIKLYVDEDEDEDEDKSESELKGTVLSTAAATASDLGTLSLQVASETQTLQVSAEARMESDGKLIALTDLLPGDVVEVKVEGDLVVRIKVEKAEIPDSHDD